MSNNTTSPRRYDLLCLLAVFALISIGVIMIFSTSYVSGFAIHQDSYRFVKRHTLFLIIGLAAMIFGMRFSHYNYKKRSFYLLMGALFLLALVFVPGVGVTLGGATRWIRVGIQIQPAEIAKFCIIVFVATSLEYKHKVLHDFKKGLLPILMVVVIPLIAIAMQPDLGNTILIAAVIGVLIYLSETPISKLLYLGLAAIGAGAASIIANPYQLDRIKTFLEPGDSLGKGYHITQSLIAIGSGGLFGLGLGESRLKNYYLPLQYSDFIFSILCEEGGFILSAVVICLFALLCYSGFQIARRAQSKFSFYLAIGMTLMLVVQALINMGVVMGVFPVTGIPLTFISFGGTALVSSMFQIGVLINIYNYPSPESVPKEQNHEKRKRKS